MWPVLLAPPWFPVVVKSYPLLLVLTVVLGFAASLMLARRLANLPARRVALALALVTASALAGARLHFLWATPVASSGWRTFVFWEGGVHAPGGLVGLALGVPIACRLLHVPLATFADILAPAAAVSLAVHRVACFMRGCCFGSFCAFPWCVRYPRGSFAFVAHTQVAAITGTESSSAAVHPLPLYYLGLSLFLAGFGLWRYQRRRYPGDVALLTLLVFSLGTVLLEPYRAVTDATVFVGGWPQLSLAAALLAAVAVVLLVVAETVHRRMAEHGP